MKVIPPRTENMGIAIEMSQQVPMPLASDTEAYLLYACLRALMGIGEMLNEMRPQIDIFTPNSGWD